MGGASKKFGTSSRKGLTCVRLSSDLAYGLGSFFILMLVCWGGLPSVWILVRVRELFSSFDSRSFILFLTGS